MGKKDIELAMKCYPQHAISLSQMPTTNAMEDRIHHYHLPYQRARQFRNEPYTIPDHHSGPGHHQGQVHQKS